MASSGNFAILNEFAQGSRSDLAEADTLMEGTNIDITGVAATMGITSGKFYWEMTAISPGNGSSAFVRIGLSSGFEGGGEYHAGYANVNGVMCAVDFKSNGTLRDNSGNDAFDYWGTITLTDTGIASYTDNDVIGVAFDFDNKKLWFSKNGTFFNSGDPAGGSNQQISWTGDLRIIYPAIETFNTGDLKCNFGQDSTFGGRISAGGNSDENGFGDFKYTPPTGYLALCSANLPVSDDIDPAQTDDNFPQKQFNCILYTGNSSTNAITGLGFQPDLVWFKRRDYTGNYNQGIIDSSRGVSVGMYPDRTDVDTNFTSDFNSFDSDGFTLKAGSSANINNSGSSFVAWCWRCAGGTTSSNSDGALTSTVQVNQEAGFSMSLYTSNGSGSSFGHGLGATPDYFMIKKRDNQARNWMGWHRDLTTPTTAYIRWNLSNAQGNDTQWDSTAHDSTKIYVNNSTTEVNSPSGDSYICYAWRGIDGYSKFGSYNGSGNGARGGPFIYTGFRPRLLFLKSTGTSDDWIVIDTARSTVNVTNRSVSYNTQDAEVTSNREVIILANGFKIQTSNTNLNKLNTKYIYGCWGDVPFKYGNTFG